MPSLSTADHGVSPPAVSVPRDYNAAHDLVERNLAAGRGGKLAYIDDAGRYTYAELAERVNRAANALTSLGLEMEHRVMLAHLDTIDWPSVFLGAIKSGIVPVAVNTLLTSADYEYMLRDSRARALVVSEQLLPVLEPAIKASPLLEHVVVSGGNAGRYLSLQALMTEAGPRREPAPTTSDDPCFWLYSSGSTGAPKGTVHVHSSAILTAELYARPILGIREQDVVFSAAKLFFAYGLGNALSFPLAAGATTILMAERPTPDAVFKRLTGHRPTIFYGVPTLFAALLAAPSLPKRADVAMRLCTSAGEALPADIGKRWTDHFGVEILDGIGSTEMLHIFLSNRPGEVRYGTTGKPVPGYELRLVDEHGDPVRAGELGELQINGPTAAAMYWNNRARSRDTFIGAWTRSGDKYTVDADGYYTYGGRSDDMLKVSGIYVSPFEVEAALLTHPDVLEAAVIGVPDEQDLIKPKAFVVAKQGVKACDALGDALKQHVKDRLAPYKYPRWVEFVPELPKTATGKIQRFKLRAREEDARK
ncbi:MAG: benzoate-CoA ligase family protein [Burkholderiales bacterium]|nr:benzoate-CoA ligase family protein [Burkholderiales bacterium]